MNEYVKVVLVVSVAVIFTWILFGLLTIAVGATLARGTFIVTCVIIFLIYALTDIGEDWLY